MSGQTNPHGQQPGAEEWNERYGDDQMWSGHPNEQLVVEVSELPAGRALDVGCGEGADAIWLAERGWRTTGIDVSPKALSRATRAAEMADVDVAWRAVGLAELTETDASAYDLVIAFYPALIRDHGAIIEALLGTVAPGGTLLVVHHSHVDRERAHEHGFDPDDYVRHQDLVAALTEREGWRIDVAEERGRTSPEGPGAHHTTDMVLRARRAWPA